MTHKDTQSDHQPALLERALEIAVQAHLGQRDKAGAPYLFHPVKLALQAESEEAMIVALLHDVVEDADEEWSFEDLREEGFTPTVVEALRCLTKADDEHGTDAGYAKFIQRIKGNKLARRVKLLDLADNMNLLRLETLSEKDLSRQAKYHRAWQELQGD
ncbi:HD domain-containing protein [Desulfoferula mesophila]|uniref:HD domain-containing protein n=1 Tax=Desulfoferula mesophila TaxID=3058419 RepID=A0AAU9EHD8_9BACT|nr:hypothetical protein FAK_24760 [Desulfoferula mesophilus]